MNSKLEALLDSDERQEALFAAFRHVALCASKETGPRLVALLTARLISEQRPPTDAEERLLLASEALSDADFLAMLRFLEQTAARAHSHGAATHSEVEVHDGLIYCRLHTEVDDTNFTRGEIDLSSVNFAEELGTWALKLRNAGLVADRVVLRRRAYSEDSERHVDQPNVETQWSWWVVIHQDLLGFVALMRAAVPPDAS